MQCAFCGFYILHNIIPVEYQFNLAVERYEWNKLQGMSNVALFLSSYKTFYFYWVE